MSIEWALLPETWLTVNQTRQRIVTLAGQIHDAWRQTRFRRDSNDYEPRVKKTTDTFWILSHGGIADVDIANTAYENLPWDWQRENEVSAAVAIDEVQWAMATEKPLDDEFLKEASTILHDKWMDRNAKFIPPEQKKPYDELSPEDREKDRMIIRSAIEICSKKA